MRIAAPLARDRGDGNGAPSEGCGGLRLSRLRVGLAPLKLNWAFNCNSEDELMRKLFLAIVAVALVSAASLSSHRAEATMPVATTAVEAAVHAGNSIQPVVCVMRRVCARGVCAMRRVCG
jgi:hypothetical protein